MRKLFLFTIAIFLIGVGFAIPPEPMAFYGNVTYNGTLISNGYYITAKINDNINGECEIFEGYYGKGENSCIIVGHGSEGALIEFYLGNVLLGTYNFDAREIINLNLEASSLPTSFIPKSNGICEADKGECSYNILDCDNSITDVCSGNGVCEPHLGETCSNVPEDCGECPPVEPNTTTKTTSSGGGGGSSGGGGGGGAVATSSNSEENDENLNSSTSDSNLNVQIKEDSEKSTSNEDSEQKNRKSFFSFLTGWATESGDGLDSGDVQIKNWVKWALGVIVLCIIGLVIFKRIKNNHSKK
jgi:hypothetical protein